MDQSGELGLDFSPDYNLTRYLQNIRKFPILEQDEEYHLALEYQKTHDKKIAYKLITSHLRLVVKVVRWVCMIPGLKRKTRRFLVKNNELLHNIDEQIISLHHRDKRAFYSSLVLEYFSRIVQSLEIFFMLLLFGVDGGGDFAGLAVTFLHSILILSFTSLFANMIGFLPMQLGVQEGGFVISIAALGLSAALGIFVSIICRVREIIWIVIGLLLMRIEE